MIDIGEKIESLLLEKRIPKKDLIEVLGITRSGLHHKMKSNSFKAGDISLMAEFFKVNKEYFLEEKEEWGQSQQVQEIQVDDSKVQQLIDRVVDELRLLRQQLQKKDDQIDKLLNLLGKPKVSQSIPPVGKFNFPSRAVYFAHSLANTAGGSPL